MNPPDRRPRATHPDERAPVATLCDSQGTLRSRTASSGRELVLSGVQRWDGSETTYHASADQLVRQGENDHGRVDALLEQAWSLVSSKKRPTLSACSPRSGTTSAATMAGMAGHKLIGRMEHVEWNPPVLTFVIERHGGTVLGSTRAELQRWTVDLDRKTATCERAGHRQLSPMAKRVDVGSIADEVANKIVGGESDDRLTWLEMGVSGWRWAGSSPLGQDSSRPSRDEDGGSEKP